MYSKRTWLNRNDSPSTGSVVAYDGTNTYGDGEYRSTFLKIYDCFESVKLHKADYDTMDDFIDKLKLLKNDIEAFIAYLEENKDEEV